MRKYATCLLAVWVMAFAAHAQTETPSSAELSQQALKQAQEKAHQRTEKLEAMTEQEWTAHKQKHPGKNPLESLLQARVKAHEHERRMDSMTALQYQNWARRHPHAAGADQ